MPFFSVIIPNYNHARFLQQRVESVLNQTFTDFEIIFLDDNSTDESTQILSKFKSNEKVSYLDINEKNSGYLTKQWKKGIELAKGNWIWIAESDDWATPCFLEEFFRMIENNPNADLFYCDSLIAKEGLKNIIGKFSTRKNELFATQKWSLPYCKTGLAEINECLKFDSTINNMSAVVFSKEKAAVILEAVGSFRYFGDWFFYISFCLNSNICYTPQTLNTYRIHPKSLLNATISLTVSKTEYFKILKLLYRDKKITFKRNLLSHFTYNYLSFGIKEDGLVKGFHIIKSYFISDRLLALRVVRELILIKLFYRKYKAKFELKSNYYS